MANQFQIVISSSVSYVEFSKFDFDEMLLMYISILKQVHVIHIYISYCFIFEVSDICIALALTMLPLQASDAWTHKFHNT